MQALNALNADSERAVIDAAGASRLVIANPTLLLGLLAALLVLFNSHVVGPAASSAFQNGVRAVNADAISLFLRPGRFEEIQSGLVVSIEDARGSQIDGLFLADTRDPSVDLNYFAREAQIIDRGEDSFLVLQNGQLHRRIPDTGEVSVIEFQTYAFDLSTFRPLTSEDWIRMSERSTAELLRPDPNDPTQQARPARIIEELTARRSDWLYPIAFTFWAVVVAGHARTNRQGAGPAMMIALGGALVLKALGFVSLSMIGDNPRLAAVAYAVPLSSIALSAMLYRTNTDVVQLPVVRSIARAFAQFGSALRRITPGVAASEGAGHA